MVDDVSKTPPRTSAPAPLSEGNTTADVLKNGSEQADVDETISASITVNEKSNHSISGNEDGVESLSAKDIGVSEVKVDPTIDNPQVSSPKDRDASKIEKSSAPQVMPYLFCDSRFCSEIKQMFHLSKFLLYLCYLSFFTAFYSEHEGYQTLKLYILTSSFFLWRLWRHHLWHLDQFNQIIKLNKVLLYVEVLKHPRRVQNRNLKVLLNVRQVEHLLRLQVEKVLESVRIQLFQDHQNLCGNQLIYL